MAYQDFFGYLPVEQSFAFTFGSVTLVGEFASAAEWVNRHSCVDGYLYPELGRSNRPGLLHQLPVTHRIDLPNDPDDQQAARYGLAGFLMHMLAFLYGYRCHFHDWWVDGRVNIKSTCDYHRPRLQEVVYCIETAIVRWNSWPPRQRTVALNALYLKTRTRIYALEWESFQAEYQVFDAPYALGRHVAHVPAVKHKNRIPAICDKFSIACDQSLVDTIVRLRNDLVHEALWDRGMPGEARSEEAYYSSIWLDHLCKRVALALLGMNGPYVQSSWWTLSPRAFAISRSRF